MKKLIGMLVMAVLVLGMASTLKAEPLKMVGPNIGGDICYDLRESSLAYGPSYTIGTFGKAGMFELKGMWVVFEDESVPNKLGAGVAISIPKALTAIGVQGIPKWFNSSVGILGLADVSDGIELSVGIYATIVKIEL